MASPQTEDGYTRIANELFEAVLVAPFSKRQLLIVMAVIRQTYGYNRVEDDISGSRLSELTGIRRNHCTDTVAELEKMMVLARERGRWGQIVSIQKDYDKWQVGSKSGPETGSVTSQNRTSSHIPKQDHLDPETGSEVSQNGIETDPETGHTKDNKHISKNNFKDTCAQSEQNGDESEQVGSDPPVTSKAEIQKQLFESWWRVYPKKRSKGAALTAWKKIAPAPELVTEMIAATERAKSSPDWQKDGGQYIPYPATWLRAMGWEDDMNVDVANAPAGNFGATVNNLQELFGGAKNIRRADRVSVGGI